jgi:hypothetical protein
MALGDIHYEVFLRLNGRAPWRLMDATDDRNEAQVTAESLHKSHPEGGVKIIKETFDADKGAFCSILTHSYGRLEDSKKKASRIIAPEGASLVCLGPRDLFKPEARKLIGRLMETWLQRHRILPGELVYRTDLIEILESSGVEITHAIQRIAIAREPGEDGLHALVRQLQDMVSRAIETLFTEVRKDRLPHLDQTGLAGLKKKMGDRALAEHGIGHALAQDLRAHQGWEAKLERLIELWAEAEAVEPDEEGPIRRSISSLFSEWLEMPGAYRALISGAKQPGDGVERLVQLLEGKVDWESDAAQSLARAIGAGKLVEARRSTQRRAFAELSSNRRLWPDSLATEVGHLKSLADRMVRVVDPCDRVALVEAFCDRSNRLMAGENLMTYLEGKHGCERVEALIALFDDIAGQSANEKLSRAIRAEIETVTFERAILANPRLAMSNLRALGQCQRAVLASKMEPDMALLAAQSLDQLAVRLLGASKIIAELSDQTDKPLERAVALFSLATHTLPSGQSARMAADAGVRLVTSIQGQAALEARPEAAAELKSLAREAKANVLKSA